VRKVIARIEGVYLIVLIVMVAQKLGLKVLLIVVYSVFAFRYRDLCIRPFVRLRTDDSVYSIFSHFLEDSPSYIL